MEEGIIGIVIGAIVTLATQLITMRISIYKSKLESNDKYIQLKRQDLSEVYRELISTINLYPSRSPYDVMKNIDYAPGYSRENFDGVITSLNYQIEDYEKQLKSSNKEYKESLRTEILNREYAKKEITIIKSDYVSAVEKYNSFCKNRMAEFELYAGINVKNNLVRFEVAIHNIFFVGRHSENTNDPFDNIIEKCKRELVNSMRIDIGEI